MNSTDKQENRISNLIFGIVLILFSLLGFYFSFSISVLKCTSAGECLISEQRLLESREETIRTINIKSLRAVRVPKTAPQLIIDTVYQEKAFSLSVHKYSYEEIVGMAEKFSKTAIIDFRENNQEGHKFLWLIPAWIGGTMVVTYLLKRKKLGP